MSIASKPPSAFTHQLALTKTEDWAEQLATSAEAVPWTTPVPACPDWDVGALVRHTGCVHRFVGSLVADRVSSRPDPETVHFQFPDSDAEASAWIAWYRAGAAKLLATLDDTPPETLMWAWGEGQYAGFWWRRMAHETLVHAIDAHQAAGRPFHIDPVVAIDTIDEFLENLRHSQSFLAEDTPFTGSGMVHLHATDEALPDGAGEWMIAYLPAGYDFRHGHAKGDAAVRGTAAELMLLTYGRSTVDDGVEVLGDRATLDRWLAGARLH